MGSWSASHEGRRQLLWTQSLPAQVQILAQALTGSILAMHTPCCAVNDKTGKKSPTSRHAKAGTKWEWWARRCTPSTSELFLYRWLSHFFNKTLTVGSHRYFQTHSMLLSARGTIKVSWRCEERPRWGESWGLGHKEGRRKGPLREGMERDKPQPRSLSWIYIGSLVPSLPIGPLKTASRTFSRLDKLAHRRRAEAGQCGKWSMGMGTGLCPGSPACLSLCHLILAWHWGWATFTSCLCQRGSSGGIGRKCSAVVEVTARELSLELYHLLCSRTGGLHSFWN